MDIFLQLGTVVRCGKFDARKFGDADSVEGAPTGMAVLLGRLLMWAW